MMRHALLMLLCLRRCAAQSIPNLHVLSLAGAAILLTSPAAYGATGAPRCTAFIDVTVVATDRAGSDPHRTVVVRGKTTQKIGPSSKMPAAECVKVPGHDRFLIPGLVDSHVHFFGYTRGSAGDLGVERDILLMLLANGITTAAVMEGTPEILLLRDRVNAGSLAGPRLFVAGKLIQMKDSWVLPGRSAFNTPEEVRREVVQEKKAGYDFVKVHGDLPPETYTALLETARSEEIPVVGHVPNNLGIHVALAGGQQMITHAESYLDSYFRFHRELPTDPAEIDAMVAQVAKETAAAHVFVQPTLSVFRQIIFEVADIDAELQRSEMADLPQVATADWRPPNNPYLKHWTLADLPALRSQYALMQRLVRGLRDAGVPLLVGTDPMVPVQLPGFSVKDEMRQLAEAGLTPFEVLQAATWNQAKFLGTVASSGSIAPGKVADLILLAADPLEDVSNLSRQDGVMLKGRWYSEAELERMLATARVQLATESTQTEPVLTIRDLRPKFLEFYQTATKEHASEERRFELWKQMYDFAAVPPTPEGDKMARKILDDAWPKYPEAIGTIERGRAALQPPPTEVLKAVTDLLQADVPIRATLLLFVGGFDNNAFTAPGRDGIPTVAIPVEGDPLNLVLTHEFTHVVEGEQAQLSFGWERSVAHTIFTEGLAMRATQKLDPGHPDRTYTGEFTPNWFARAETKRSEILADITPHIEESDATAVMRYTMGIGGAGLEREGYYTGWLVIGDLLDHGWTFPRLARVKDAEMAAIVKESLDRLQAPGGVKQVQRPELTH